MDHVWIKKGYWKGKPALIKQKQKDETNGEYIYELIDRKGKKIWNGNLTWFPESFLDFRPA